MLRIKDGAAPFNVDDQVPEDDEIYGPPKREYLKISSAVRDDDVFIKSGRRSIVKDWNHVMRRWVSFPMETAMEKRTPGRTRLPKIGPIGSRAKKTTTSRRNAVNNAERIKIPRRVTGESSAL